MWKHLFQPHFKTYTYMPMNLCVYTYTHAKLQSKHELVYLHTAIICSHLWPQSKQALMSYNSS